MAVRISIVVEENRNFHVTTHDDQPIRVTNNLRYGPIIFTLMEEHTFECSFSSLVKMMKYTLRKNTGNREYLDANYRDILRFDQFFKVIHCNILDFFELFDDYFRINGGPRVLHDIYVPYPYILSRPDDCKENTMVRNIITNKKHPISEFKDISSASIWGYPSTYFSNVKMTEDLFKKMIKYHESYRRGGVRYEGSYRITSQEHNLHEKILNFAIEKCKIFNQSMDSQRQGLDLFPNKCYLTESIYLLYFNHLHIVEDIMRNYQ